MITLMIFCKESISQFGRKCQMFNSKFSKISRFTINGLNYFLHNIFTFFYIRKVLAI
jgi:hypothetical protein